MFIYMYMYIYRTLNQCRYLHRIVFMQYFVLKTLNSVHYCIGVWLYFLLFTVKTLAGLSDEEDFCDVVDCLETLSIEKCMIVRNALSSSSALDILTSSLMMCCCTHITDTQGASCTLLKAPICFQQGCEQGMHGKQIRCGFGGFPHLTHTASSPHS